MSAHEASLATLFGHDPATYRSSVLHAEGRIYRETNCYADVLIELLHARGDDPVAALGSTIRTDFEGDQWSFFKPRTGDLEALFGVDVHEMQPYRPLPVQIDEQVRAGRTIIVELDSWYLPDTSATSYRTEHVKTSVAVEAIDVAGERLRYYHNAGLHELAGDDFRGVFRLGRAFSDDVLPPYTELVRFDAGPRLAGEELRAAARERLQDHLHRRPAGNPFERFGERLAGDLPGLLAGDAATYHAYAFATARMVGSAFELCATHVDWLLGQRGADASTAMTRIAEGAATLSFKLARRRPFDPRPSLAALATAWDEAVVALARAL